MRRITRRTFGQLALGTLGAAALTGCARGGPAPGAGGAPSSPAVGGQTASWVPDRPLKIGVITSVSGVFASAGQAGIAGIRLAVREFEEKGWRFEPLLIEDEKADPATGLRALQKLVERDRVHCVIGPLSSGVLPALRDPVDQAKVIMSTVQAATRDITGARCSRYIFRTTPTNYMQGYGFGGWIARHLGKKVYVLTADYAAGTEIADAIVEGCQKEGGEVLSYAKAPLATTDFAPYMPPILDARPDVVTGFFAGKNAIDVVKAFHQFGIKDRVTIAYSGYLTSNDIIEAQGAEATEGIYEYLNFSESLETPEFTSWAAKLVAQSPEYARIPVYCVHGYTATKAVLVGIEQARSLDSDAIASAMERSEFVGPTGPIRFGPGHQAALDFYVTQVRGMKHIVLERIPQQTDPQEAECRRTWG
jgi:branched-chain amino acid transport system substrate-binding protein